MYTLWPKVRAILFSVKSGLVTASLLAGFSFSAPAQAQVTCGGEVGPNETVTLVGSISICDDSNGGGVVVRGPATLDLNGFDIRCADLDSDGLLPQGIVLLGTRAKVRNGTITNCGIGVHVGGSGRHFVKNVHTIDPKFGIVVSSGLNRIFENEVTDPEFEGILVAGDQNNIRDNRVEGSLRRSGIVVSGDRSGLAKNFSAGNNQHGFALSGERNRMVRNDARGNRFSGISVQGERHSVLRNFSVGNGNGIRLGNTARRVSVNNNNATANNAAGILADPGSADNRLSRNSAFFNGGQSGDPDLFDSNFDADLGFICGTNRWRNNQGTRNQSCID